jgi:hypothetical protein
MFKIIFLDIDGVLNSTLYYENLEFKEIKADQNDRFLNKLYDIDEKAISFLNHLIKNTGAKIVISSTWRKNTAIEELTKLFKMKGFIGEIIDYTPRLGEGNLRGNEILKWIENNITLIGQLRHEYRSYVIFDDDSDMLYWQRNNFILIDGYVGLTPNNVYKAEYILNN